ncbi:unnamed protein product, partial [Allacma fusca]
HHHRHNLGILCRPRKGSSLEAEHKLITYFVFFSPVIPLYKKSRMEEHQFSPL